MRIFFNPKIRTFSRLALVFAVIFCEFHGQELAAQAKTINIKKPNKVHYRVKMLGKFITIQDSDLEKIPYRSKYFFHFIKDGKDYAYPVELADKSLAKAIKKNEKDTFWIEADVRVIPFKLEKTETDLVVLSLKKAGPLKISWLGVPFNMEWSQKLAAQEPEGKLMIYKISDENLKYESRIFIPDSWANGLILASGAVLLAGILINSHMENFFFAPSPYNRPLF